jgi:hypothetical protein
MRKYKDLLQEKKEEQGKVGRDVSHPNLLTLEIQEKNPLSPEFMPTNIMSV